MDELTFISGCVLAGMIAKGTDLYDSDREGAGTLLSLRRLALMHLHRIERAATQRPIMRGDGAPISDRDAFAALTAIVEAVDEVGGWPTPEAKVDADVVCWVRESTLALSRAYDDLRQVRELVGATADEPASAAVRRALERTSEAGSLIEGQVNAKTAPLREELGRAQDDLRQIRDAVGAIDGESTPAAVLRVFNEQNTELEQSNQTQAALRCECNRARTAALRGDATAPAPSLPTMEELGTNLPEGLTWGIRGEGCEVRSADGVLEGYCCPKVTGGGFFWARSRPLNAQGWAASELAARQALASALRGPAPMPSLPTVAHPDPILPEGLTWGIRGECFEVRNAAGALVGFCGPGAAGFFWKKKWSSPMAAGHASNELAARQALAAAFRDAGANESPPPEYDRAISELMARIHAKRIDAAQDAAENEVLKARNARLRAQQVRLLAALEKARELAKCAAHLNNEVDVIRHEPCVELIELIDLLKLECEKDQGDG